MSPGINSLGLGSTPLLYHSKLNTIGFAIVTILGVGCLAAGGLGAYGYFQTGALSTQAILMMTAGGGGAILSTVGIVGVQRNCRSRLVFGKDAWEAFGVKVLDDISHPPEIDWNALDPIFNEPYRKNYVLYYEPGRVEVDGEEQDFNPRFLSPFMRATNDLHVNLTPEKLSERPASPGWRLGSITLTRPRRREDDALSFDWQNSGTPVVEGFQTPTISQATIVSMILKKFRGDVCFKDGYEGTGQHYTYCESISDQDSNDAIIVGKRRTNQPGFEWEYPAGDHGYAVAPVKRFPSA